MSYLEKVKIELVNIFNQYGVAELEDIRFLNSGDVTKVSYCKGDYKISIILQPLAESNGVKTIIDAIWYYPKNDYPQMLQHLNKPGEIYDYQDDVVSVIANSMMERIDYLYHGGITKIPHYKDVEDVLQQKSENNKLDSKKARKIWKVLLSNIQDESYTSDKLTIWSICNDLIMKFPELEGEEDLQKEFVELYNKKNEK